MPELPEVETVVRTLSPSALDRTIIGANVLWPGSVAFPEDLEQFAARLKGRRISGLRRRAKLAVLDLDGDMHLAVHLKMTGRLLARPEGYEPEKHDRLVLDLDSGTRLVFNDTRKFGKCRAATSRELAQWDFYASLGPEPLETEPGVFARRVGNRGARIKALLLDQRVIAGVGNIYADETLHQAGIRPDRRACDIPDADLCRVHQCLTEVLARAIRENGSSIRDYLDADGNAGAFQNSFQVYGRKGQACLRCGAPLECGVVAGRTTVWCPSCQR